MNFRIRHALGLLLALSSLPAAARESAATCLPEVRQGWIRLLPGGMPMHAGFARIVNRCTRPVALVSARSPGYASIELHETRNIAGVMRMRELPAVRIPAGESVTLKPGGIHLMLMDPVRPLRPGNRVAIVFVLSDNREVVGEFIARKPD